jgi:hypothetical protein
MLNNIRRDTSRQIEIHTVKPLVPNPSPFEFEIAVATLERNKSPGIDQIPADIFKQEVKYEYYVL